MFLENFQKAPGRPSYGPRQATHTNFTAFLGSFEESPGCEEPPSSKQRAARRHIPFHLVSGFLNERHNADEHSSGDASQIDLILVFWVV